MEVKNTHNVFVEKAHKYIELKKRIEALQDELADVKEYLVGHINVGEPVRIDEGCTDKHYIKVSYTEFTQKRFDSTKFKKENKAQYDKYIKEVKTSKFTCDMLEEYDANKALHDIKEGE